MFPNTLESAAELVCQYEGEDKINKFVEYEQRLNLKTPEQLILFAKLCDYYICSYIAEI